MTRTARFVRNYGKLKIGQSGILLGADDSRGFHNSSHTGIEDQLGRTLAIHNRHYGWNDGHPGWPNEAEKKDISQGVVPMISWMGAGNFPCVTKPPNGGDTSSVNGHKGLARVTAGEFDDRIKTAFAVLAALEYPVIFRLWMEMNGSHNPYFSQWQGGGQAGTDAFVQAWTHIHSIAKAEGATPSAGGSVIFVFCPQAYTKGTDWKAYWPGAQHVTWMGVDLYRNTFSNFAAGASPQDYYQFGQSNHKPFIVCENGYEQGAVVSTPVGKFDKDGSKTGHSLITHVFDECATTFQDVIAFVMWNAVGPVGNDYIDTSSKSLDAYRKAAKSQPYASMAHVT